MSVVFALATPPSKSAICVFRVSGNGCNKYLRKMFVEKEFLPNKFYTRLLKKGNKIIDKVGLVVFKGPKSYTGEDSFEIYAHGSLAVMSSIIDLFKALGLEEAVAGEFTKRAFLNNKITLNEAESLNDLIKCQDDFGLALSGNSMFGDLSRKINSFGSSIDNIRVRIEAEIDFSDEGNEYFDESLTNDLGALLVDFESFISACVSKKEYDKKNKVVLVGPANSGKSSVFNRLLGYKRSIVSDMPGTTRDMISSEMFYESSSFSVLDTAGIRSTDDLIEKKGIDISMQEIKSSDLVLGVFENNNIKNMSFFKSLCKEKKYICIRNKIDIDNSNHKDFDCYISAKTGVGFNKLKTLIKDSFDESQKNHDYEFLIKERHEKLFYLTLTDLKKSFQGMTENISLELVAEDLKNARSNLDEVIGVKFTDSLLGDIFNSFCIGK